MCLSQRFYSTLLPVLSGVPQGSILGPLLFLVYTSDLFLSIHHSKALSYADDTKCYKFIFELMDSLKLQDYLDSLSDWSGDNLCFNAKKCVHLSFNTNISTSYNIDDSMIMSNRSHQDLGIILSTDLSWKNHYDHISSKAY